MSMLLLSVQRIQVKFKFNLLESYPFTTGAPQLRAGRGASTLKNNIDMHKITCPSKTFVTQSVDLSAYANVRSTINRTGHKLQ